MADEEEAGEHARERCSLLRTLKHTVENLLTMDLGDKLDTSDCLKRMISDLQSIMKHGQREQEAAHKVDDEGMDTNISLIEETESMLQQALPGHCLSLYLLDLMNNARQISYWYQEYAFLRSAPHVEAMFTCIQAFEKGDRQLLTQIDSVLLNKRKYDVELWLSGSEDLDSQNDIQGTVIDEIQVVYSDSTSSEREDFVSSYGSPGDALVNVTEYSPDCNAGADKENDFQLSSSEAGQKFSYSPRNITDLTTDNKGSGKSHGLALAGLRTTEPSRIAQNVKATLAHAALSAVLESDEVKPASWFDSQSEDKFYRIRKASSTGSLNDNFIHFQNDIVDGNTVFENSNSYKPGLQPTGGSSSELSGRKAFGHCRSKSDQVGVPKFQELGINKPKKSEQTQQNSSIGVTQLSSSLPTSESLYSSDPYLENPYEEQSLAEMLASQDFSSCELDKENAHFSISEALIAAIEQMKCDDFNTSEEEDDEEICHLKKELERKRREKKQGRHEKEQLAFSDETTQSTTSEPSTATTSSKSACESEDELSHDWEEISPSDKQLQQYNNEFCMSTTTLVSTEDNSSAEAKNSSQLSAETVAKCLLQKFANRRHPAASELQWLVSFQDAPQSLLPLPKTVAVAPDDVPQVDSLKRNNSVSRQNSLPCRIRGNAEWAPPRAQIIFHAHKPPRRKTLMSQQNFRCAGCGMAVAPDYIKRFRYCHYLGKYFCSSCHSNFLEVIPANVIRKWDFTRYEVSNFAKDLLQRIHCDPLFDVKDLNPSLYKRFRVLEELKGIRQQLHFFKTFMQTCRKANELAEEYSKLPDHICGDLHLYSMQDLLQARDGDLLLFLRGLAIKSLNHINQCQLCLAKGFICEYCKNGDDIIFPFELTRVVQCSGCRASFHKECFVAGKCPKCERIRIRKQSLSKPVSSEEDDSSGSWLR